MPKDISVVLLDGKDDFTKVGEETEESSFIDIIKSFPSIRLTTICLNGRHCNSALADGGPRSRVCSCDTPTQPPINMSGNFPAQLSVELVRAECVRQRLRGGH